MTHKTRPLVIQAIRVRDRHHDGRPDWLNEVEIADVGTKGNVQLSRPHEPHVQTLSSGDWIIRLPSGRIMGVENQDFGALFEAQAEQAAEAPAE